MLSYVRSCRKILLSPYLKQPKSMHQITSDKYVPIIRKAELMTINLWSEMTLKKGEALKQTWHKKWIEFHRSESYSAVPCSLYTSIFCRSNNHRCIFNGTSRQPNANQTDRGCFCACKYAKKMFGVCKRNFILSFKTQRTKGSNVFLKYCEQNHNFGIGVCTQSKCSQLHLDHCLWTLWRCYRNVACRQIGARRRSW